MSRPEPVRPPLVGISAGNSPHVPGHYILRWDYVHAVAAAGAVPVILAPGPAASRPGYVDSVTALVLSGGIDINPTRYSQAPHPSVTQISDERDEFELGLLAEGLERRLPILAICRGLQLLNVHLGGTLVQDLPSTCPSLVSHNDPARPRTDYAHGIRVADGCRLHTLTGRERFAVNSFHHQAVDRLAPGLTATAWADDDVIEAVELVGDRWVVGVQWHPESLWQDGPPSFTLFEGLVAAARAQAP